jgi:DNA repair protein RadA
LELEQIPGIGKSIAKRLRDAGFANVEALAITPARELKERAKYEKIEAAQRIVEAAREALGCKFIKALEYWELEKNKLRCTTGSKALDDILGGGIETRAITEFGGKYGSGKTQICQTLCVTAQFRPENGGLGGNVLYFDTEGTFSAKRVYQIAAENGLDPAKVLNNIILSRVYNSEHQMFLLNHSFDKCVEENVKLVIVDSVISHFRGDFIGRETLADKQQKLNFYMHKLLRLAEVLNIAVVVTNQAQTEPVQWSGQTQPLDKPAGGNILAHACNTRVWLRRAKEGKRIAKVFDSPCLPERECVFRITSKGIEDGGEGETVEEEKPKKPTEQP